MFANMNSNRTECRETSKNSNRAKEMSESKKFINSQQLPKKSNLNYLLYEIPEQYSSSSTLSSKSSNYQENKIKISIKDQDSSNEGVFKRNYEINFNSSKLNKESLINNHRNNIFDSTSNEFSSKMSKASSKQSLSPNSLYSSNMKTDYYLTEASSRSEDYLVKNVGEVDDSLTSKNNILFLDLISSINADKNINEHSYKSNISKQLRINQKMSHLKSNMEKKDVFANQNEKYFYSDIKFVNDEINEQFKNMKKQTNTCMASGLGNKFITQKYRDAVRDSKGMCEERVINSSEIVTFDALNRLSQQAWEQAEAV